MFAVELKPPALFNNQIRAVTHHNSGCRWMSLLTRSNRSARLNNDRQSLEKATDIYEIRKSELEAA